MDRQTFFKHLYQHSYGFVEFRGIGGERVVQTFLEWSDTANIEDFVASWGKSKNIYFGVATRDGKNGKKENIVHIPAVWCDVDYKDTPRDELKKLYERFPYKASIIVLSGGGVHFYWILKEALRADAIPQVEDANRRIAQALKGDLVSCDAARILRVPDTINHKYKDKPEVQVTKLENFFYEWQDFDILPPVENLPASSPATVPQNDDIKQIQKCLFVKWCHDHPAEVSEPLWYAMISNVAGVRPGGVSLCHELSKGYPGYKRKETDAKILHALDSSRPMMCEEIRKRGFNCEKSCEVASPAGLVFDFEYYDDGAQDDKIKVSVG